MVGFSELGTDEVAAHYSEEALAPSLHPGVVTTQDGWDAFLAEEVFKGGWSIGFRT